jgi:hypothetical protein
MAARSVIPTPTRTLVPRRGAKSPRPALRQPSRWPALLAALATAGVIAAALAGSAPAATAGVGAAIAGQPPTVAAQPPVAAQQPSSISERLNVREVELVLEAPPVLLGVRDLRLRNFDLLGTRDGGLGVKLPLPARRGLADLGPGDLLLLEDGKARPILRLEPLRAGAAHPWTLRIYFDLVLARPRTVFEAALALARQADRLADLGTVEIAVADPQPRLLPVPGRDALAIKDALAALAGQAGRDPLARPFTRISAPTPASLRRQCDRLLASLASPPVSGPHALLLVADPPQLSAAQLQRLSAVASSTRAAAAVPAAATFTAAATAGTASTAAAVAAPSAAGLASPVMGTDPAAHAAAPIPAAIPGPGDDPAIFLGDTARMLAAYGWLTLALPVHRPTSEREALPEDDTSRFRRQWWADKDSRAGIPFLPLIRFIVQTFRDRKPPSRPDRRLVAPQIDMEYASLAALVRPGAGTVLAAPEQLAPALDALAARWHLWYQADATPAGRERPIAVSLAGNALDVRTARWVRSSTPEALAAARLRRLLDGDDVAGSLPISATILASPPPAAGLASGSDTAETGVAPEPLVLLARASPAGAADPAASGPVRVSFAWSDAAGRVEVKHRLLDAGEADAWLRQRTLRLTAPPPAAGRPRIALMIEDLASEIWGAAVAGSRSPSEAETGGGNGAAPRRPSGASDRRGPKLSS